MQAHSVKDLLAQAATAPLPNYNKPTVVCPLPAEGLDGYLLRIHLPHLFGYDLENTSSLTPTRFLDRNYGQALLKGTLDFQIVKKVPGISLWHLFQEKARAPGMDPTQATLSAYSHALGALDALPPESFVDLAKQMNYLSSQGIAADLLSNNIMLEGSKLQLIDVANNNHGYKHNNLQSLQETWLHFFPMPDPTVSSPAIDALRGKINRKMEEAALIAALPHTAEEATIMFPSSKIAFRTPARITTIAELPLSATTQELRERLRDVERHNGLVLS